MYGTASAWRVPGYSEIRELGAGAAGRVVMARQDADGVLVAIKYLSDELRNDVGFVARFRHEARVLNTLDSPHAVRLYDYVETGEGAAIVMELVNGVSLREILRSEGPTGPEAALLVLKGSLLGLATAHKARIVHRDFKPENVMVEADGTSRLVDFGIAVRSGDGDAPAGTPPYMAPEQWTGASAGPSTDVYAATVVFFECLTGIRPFRATNIAALARQHQATPPPVEEVPAPLQGLVERGLAKHPADRPPSAIAFLTELEAVAADAYGPDWEERGRRRLAALAGLMASLFPFPQKAKAPESDTSLAETELGERDATSMVSKLSFKILVGIGCVAVISGVTAVLVNSGSSTELQSQSSTITQSAAPSEPLETVIPGEETDEPTAEPSAESTPEPTPSTGADTGTGPTSGPPSAAPTLKPTPTPRPSATRARRPAKKATSSPSATSTAEENSDLRESGDRPSGSPSAKPTPIPTKPTAGPTQTTRPTPRPTRTTSQPTTTPSPTDSTNPTTSPSPSGGETTPPPAVVGMGSSASTTDAAPAALVAFGLVTGGAVPFTLAVKRGVAGRHRRRR
ncbi:protein kinase [Streptosporangium sp. NPDC000396]|uniref:serine/threonine-protein kinase n=1 Tax=Streptosporangium sp. NPDC000396 TaxID=3366185 RepID=UPI0036AADBBD